MGSGQVHPLLAHPEVPLANVGGAVASVGLEQVGQGLDLVRVQPTDVVGEDDAHPDSSAHGVEASQNGCPEKENERALESA